MSSVIARLHAILPCARANGPGWRCVIWFQGCTLKCPKCFNRETHPPDAARVRVPVDQLVAQILSRQEIEGVTLSGGEPLQQPQALRALVEEIRRQSRLSVLLFSGYTRPEIMASPDGPAILAAVDVLVAGRYVAKQACAEGLRSSRNQQVHRLTKRYSEADLNTRPTGEILIDKQGNIVTTGILGNPFR